MPLNKPGPDTPFTGKPVKLDPISSGSSGPIRDIDNSLGIGGGVVVHQYPFSVNPYTKPPKPEQQSPLVPFPILNQTAPTPPSRIVLPAAAQGAPIPTLYGRWRVPGLQQWHKDLGSKFLLVYTFARGEFEQIEKIFIDGREEDVSAKTPGTTYTSSTLVGSSGNYAFWTGTSGQNVSTDYVATYASEYTDSHANYVMVAFRLDTVTYPFNAWPRVQILAKGRNDVEDPRISPSAGYTNNPALCAGHFLTTYYDPSKTMNTASLTAAADFCDESMSDGSKRLTCGLLLGDKDVSMARVRQLFEEVCQCYIVEEGDEFFMIPMEPRDSVIDIGPSRLIGEPTYTKVGKRQTPDNITAVWYDPDDNREAEADAVADAEGIAQDIPMPYVGTHEEARRRAITRYNHQRLGDTMIDFEVFSQGIRLRRGERFQFTLQSLGIEDKAFICTSIQTTGWMRQRVIGREYQASMFSDDVTAEATTPDFSLGDPNDVPTITGAAVSTSLSSPVDGIRKARATISWTDPDWLFTDSIHVRVYDTSVSPERLAGEAFVPTDQTSVLIPDLDTLTTHRADVRVKSRSGAYGTADTETFTTPTALIEPSFSSWSISTGSPTLSNGDKTVSDELQTSPPGPQTFVVYSDSTFNRATAEFYFEVAIDEYIEETGGTTAIQLGLITAAGVSKAVVGGSETETFVTYYVNGTSFSEYFSPMLSAGDVVGVLFRKQVCTFFFNGQKTISVPTDDNSGDTWQAYLSVFYNGSTPDTATFTMRPTKEDWDGISGL